MGILLVFLSDYLKQRILQDRHFQNWSSDFPRVVVDDEIFAVIHGDRLADETDLVFEWLNRFHPDWIDR